VIAVLAGSSHNLALTAGGAVWSWGNGGGGQLGHGDQQHQLLPRKVEALTGQRPRCVGWRRPQPRHHRRVERWSATLREEERGSRKRCTAVTVTVLCMAPRPGRPKRGGEGEGAKQNGACSPRPLVSASVTYGHMLSSHMSSSMRLRPRH